MITIGTALVILLALTSSLASLGESYLFFFLSHLTCKRDQQLQFTMSI